MTIEDFRMLDDNEKVKLIFDASKIAEKIDNESNYQLFQIDNFYVETKTSLEGKFKRSIKTYALRELPTDYASEVLRMPIVKLDEVVPSTNKTIVKKKKTIQ